jgi:hypothetical protein
MWFVGQQASRPPSEVSEKVRARALGYWERRLDKAIQSEEPESYTIELGNFSQWCAQGNLDDLWLCEQLGRMLSAGFAPSNAFSVVEWLKGIAPRNIDLAIELLAKLLRHPSVDQWAYITRDSIRELLREGGTRGTSHTVDLVDEVVSFLASVGETSYLDLAPRRPAML